MDASESKFKPYNRSNIFRARTMRTDPTSAEEKIWRSLLKHRPGGYKFTRQKPIGSFIVDFYCAKLFLAIELDGRIHENRLEYDKERDIFLSNQGITVIRYSNDEVRNTIDQVYKNILQIIQEKEDN